MTGSLSAVRPRLTAAVLVVIVALIMGDTGVAGGPKLPLMDASGCDPGSIHSMRTARPLSYAVTALRPLNARRALATRASKRFQTRNVNGVATVFGVLAARVDHSCRATHYKVQLPIRPNGATGWVVLSTSACTRYARASRWTSHSVGSRCFAMDASCS